MSQNTFSSLNKKMLRWNRVETSPNTLHRERNCDQSIQSPVGRTNAGITHLFMLLLNYFSGRAEAQKPLCRGSEQKVLSYKYLFVATSTAGKCLQLFQFLEDVSLLFSSN